MQQQHLWIDHQRPPLPMGDEDGIIDWHVIGGKTPYTPLPNFYGCG
jgi:hypothetical protein